MKYFFRLSIFTIFLFNAYRSCAQDITGSWEGFMTGEYLQVNIDQKGDQLCGYTWDYELRNRSGYCVANFEGNYNSDRKKYYLDGTSFIENSGTHVLMRVVLWRNDEDPKNILRGLVYIKSSFGSMYESGDRVTLKKIADRPKKRAGKVFPCFPPPPREAIVKNAPLKPIVPKPEVPAPAPRKPVTAKPIAPKPVPVAPVKPKPVPVKKDTLQKITPKPVAPVTITKRPPSQLEKIMTGRKQSQQSRISIDVKEIKLKVYDNGTVDNDTVSIFYNGRLLLSHQRLSEKAIELTIQLDENVPQHEITMFAENLGSIPPNTALIVVTAGTKRYELHSKASLEENAVLIFDYKPK